MSSDNWNTLGILETPFLLRATQRYCLMAEMKISSVLNTGPECSKMERSNFRDSFLDRSSWDLPNEDNNNKRKKLNYANMLSFA